MIHLFFSVIFTIAVMFGVGINAYAGSDELGSVVSFNPNDTDCVMDPDSCKED